MKIVTKTAKKNLLNLNRNNNNSSNSNNNLPPPKKNLLHNLLKTKKLQKNWLKKAQFLQEV